MKRYRINKYYSEWLVRVGLRIGGYSSRLTDGRYLVPSAALDHLVKRQTAIRESRRTIGESQINLAKHQIPHLAKHQIRRSMRRSHLAKHQTSYLANHQIGRSRRRRHLAKHQIHHLVNHQTAIWRNARSVAKIRLWKRMDMTP